MCFVVVVVCIYGTNLQSQSSKNPFARMEKFMLNIFSITLSRWPAQQHLKREH